MTRRHPPAGDEGVASLYVLALAVVLAAAAAAIGLLGLAVAAAHRATAAADLAALAGADGAVEGPARACSLAGTVAARNAALLESCQVTGAVVEVSVRGTRTGLSAALGPVRARARAGPSR